MTDIYINGRLEDTCQEGCSKFIEVDKISVPGGASNASRSLSHWYTQVRFPFCNLTGPVKTRFMVSDKCVFRYDHDTCDFVDSRFAQESSIKLITSSWAEGVLISDYDKGFLSEEFIREVIDLCSDRGIPCVSDVKRHPDVYKWSIIKCNADWNSKYVEDRWNEKVVSGWVLTLGSNQCVVNLSGKYDDTHLCGFIDPVDCVNHVGAGDCFSAHLTLALTHGFSLKESAEIAHSAGRVYVQEKYNTPPHLDKIKLDMTHEKQSTQ